MWPSFGVDVFVGDSFIYSRMMGLLYDPVWLMTCTHEVSKEADDYAQANGWLLAVRLKLGSRVGVI
jgi:hypothetical protein